MRYLLDTCVLIDDDKPRLAADDEWAISVVSLSELHFGVLCARDELQRSARLRRLTVIESTLHALPVTDDIARIHGAMSAHLRSIGRQPRPRAMDLLIAATAASHRATLLPPKLKDFAGLDDFVTVTAPPSEGRPR